MREQQLIRERGTQTQTPHTTHHVQLGSGRTAILTMPTDITEAELLMLSANVTSMATVMIHDD